jgi:hypothetical protein
MNTQKLLNEKYQELISAYGDLCYKRQLLDTKIASLEEAITQLDAITPALNDLGNKFTKDLVEKINKGLNSEVETAKNKAAAQMEELEKEVEALRERRKAKKASAQNKEARES